MSVKDVVGAESGLIFCFTINGVHNVYINVCVTFKIILILING